MARTVTARLDGSITGSIVVMRPANGVAGWAAATAAMGWPGRITASAVSGTVKSSLMRDTSLIVAMAVPNATFWYLASNLPTDLLHIGSAVAVEMFGYGFGFVGMILYIMQAVAPGRYQTAHYALGSGVMQLGFIFAKFISGDIQVSVGYQHFFAWTIACGLPALLLLLWVPMPRKAQTEPVAA